MTRAQIAFTAINQLSVPSVSAPSGIRLIAAFEAIKGILVLLASFGLLELVHHAAQRIADEIIQHFHFNPASHYPRIFLDALRRLNDANLWLLTGGALSYAGLRLFEAIGLWYGRRWAKWLGAVSGGMYIPVELYEILNGVTWLNSALLCLNVLCVAYLIYSIRTLSQADLL